MHDSKSPSGGLYSWWQARRRESACGTLPDAVAGSGQLIDRIRWQGHGSFAIEGVPYIQIAPWRVVKSEAPPDLILLGHDHYDHCSPADIEKIRGENTVIVGSESVGRVIPGTQVLREWQSINVGKANIKAIPALSSRDPRNQRAGGRLGFLVSLDLYDIYYVGEADTVDENTYLRPDIVLLPIDGYGRLSVTDAARLVESMQPKWAIPYNWGGPGEEATHLDAQSFRSLVTGGTEVLLLSVTP